MHDTKLVLPQLPEATDDFLLQRHNEGRVSEHCFECLRALGIAGAQLVAAIEDTEAFAETSRTPQFTVAVGHIAQCLNLSLSIMNSASLGKYGDAAEIVAEQVVRSAVQCLWLLQSTDNVATYLAHSLIEPAEMLDDLKAAPDKDTELCSRALNEMFVSVGSLPSKTTTASIARLPKFSEMAKTVGLDRGTLAFLQQASVRRISGYQYVFMRHLRLNPEGKVEPKATPKTVLSQTLSIAGLNIARVLNAYVTTFFTEEGGRAYLSEYFNRFEKLYERLVGFVHQSHKSAYLDELREKVEGGAKPLPEFSSIASHKKVRKVLTPPFAAIPELQLVSWVSQRLPDLLWSVALTKKLGRDRAMKIFVELIDSLDGRHGETVDVTISGIARMGATARAEFFAVVCRDLEARECLSHLTLLTSMPGANDWLPFVSRFAGPADESWTFLLECIHFASEHQSQVATDCRWLRVAAGLKQGLLIFPVEQSQLVQDIFEYPNSEDQGLMRSTIRSAEMAFDAKTPIPPWVELFWQECFQATACSVEPKGIPTKKTGATNLNTVLLEKIQDALQAGYVERLPTTGIDARHDAIFGIALFAIAVMHEIVDVADTSVLALFGLRTIAETVINLCYLMRQEDGQMWQKFRDHGVGQAKLNVLKHRRSSSPPIYLPLRQLEFIANEDRWEEFTAIDLGDWAGADLRVRSMQGGVKHIYDAYYGWPSCFSHGQWSALRYLVFDTCRNPLHRAHRVPIRPRPLQTVWFDVEILLTALLERVDSAYPNIVPIKNFLENLP